MPPTLGLTPTASKGPTTGFAPIPTITCTYNILLKQEEYQIFVCLLFDFMDFMFNET